MGIHLCASLLNPGASIVNFFFSTLTSWLGDGAAGIVVGAGSALEATTTVTFGSAFDAVFAAMRAFGGALALPFLLLATIHAVVHRDLPSLGRTLIVRAPVALIGSGGAIWVVKEALGVTDAMAADLFGRGTAGSTFTDNLAALLSGPTNVLSGFSGFIVALLAAAAALLVWIELEVRDAAVVAASLFIPLGFAAVIWPVTSHWIRKLAEVIATLVLAKLVMVAVLVLALSSLATASGVSGVLQGVAMLVLAALAPWSVVHLVAFGESVGRLDAVARRGVHHAVSAGSAVAGTIADLGGGDISPTRDPIPTMAPTVVDPAAYRRAYAAAIDQMDAVRRNRGEEEG